MTNNNPYGQQPQFQQPQFPQQQYQQQQFPQQAPPKKGGGRAALIAVLAVVVLVVAGGVVFFLNRDGDNNSDVVTHADSVGYELAQEFITIETHDEMRDFIERTVTEADIEDISDSDIDREFGGDSGKFEGIAASEGYDSLEVIDYVEGDVNVMVDVIGVLPSQQDEYREEFDRLGAAFYGTDEEIVGFINLGLNGDDVTIIASEFDD